MLATLALIAALTLQVQAPGPAPDAIAAAAELYAGAAYAEALDALNALRARRPSGEQAIEIEKYRALCLLGLSRTQEARQVFADILLAKPTFRLGEREVSRRVEDTFREVRRQSLPSLATRAFQRGRQAYDARSLDEAERELRLALELGRDPDMPTDAPLQKDLEILAKGYLGLVDSAKQPLAAKSLSRMGRLPAIAPVVFEPSDEEVTPPVALKQEIPGWPPGLPRLGSLATVFEIVIDERGAVESAVLRPPLNPAYDRLLLQAAKSWRFEPARRATTPVKYRRRIHITIAQKPAS